MKIIPVIIYIILENFTAQILFILNLKKIILFHSCTMCLETENIKHKEEGEVFKKIYTKKNQISSPRLSAIHLSSETS